MYLQAKILEFQCQSLSLLIQAEPKLYPDGKWRESTTGEFCSPPGGASDGETVKFDSGQRYSDPDPAIRESLQKAAESAQKEAKKQGEKAQKSLNDAVQDILKSLPGGESAKALQERLDNWRKTQSQNIEKATTDLANFFKKPELYGPPNPNEKSGWESFTEDIGKGISHFIDTIKNSFANITGKAWENAQKIFRTPETKKEVHEVVSSTIASAPEVVSAIAKEATDKALDAAADNSPKGFFGTLDAIKNSVTNTLNGAFGKIQDFQKEHPNAVAIATATLAFATVAIASQATGVALSIALFASMGIALHNRKSFQTMLGFLAAHNLIQISGFAFLLKQDMDKKEQYRKDQFTRSTGIKEPNQMEKASSIGMMQDLQKAVK